ASDKSAATADPRARPVSARSRSLLLLAETRGLGAIGSEDRCAGWHALLPLGVQRLDQILLIAGEVVRRERRDRLGRLAAHHRLRIGIDAIERRAESIARGFIA